MSVIALISAVGEDRLIDGMDTQVAKRIIDAINEIVGIQNHVGFELTGLKFIDIYTTLDDSKKLDLKFAVERAYVDGMKATSDLNETLANTDSKNSITKRWVVLIMTMAMLVVMGAFSYVVILISIVADAYPPIEWYVLIISPAFIIVALNVGLTYNGLRVILKTLKEREARVKSKGK